MYLINDCDSSYAIQSIDSALNDLAQITMNLNNIAVQLNKQNEILMQLLEHQEKRDKDLLEIVDKICAIKYNI